MAHIADGERGAARAGRRGAAIAGPNIISVAERHRRRLAPDERRAIENADGFWLLADAGYVSYGRTGPDRYEIVGHKYVGRAQVGDVEVRVQEKVPGMLFALISAATGAELRVERADSAATAFDVVSRYLVDEFTRASARYVADRRRPRYHYRHATGPVLVGTLDMPATMRLHAMGRAGLFAYRQGTVVRDEPLDRLVLAGLDELDRAAVALNLGRDTLYDVRWLAGALDEIRDAQFLAMSASDFLALGESIERNCAESPDDIDLARLAAVVLLHSGFEPDQPIQGKVPRAWFLDLETLFERAVRETLRELMTGDEVNRGQGFMRRMFTGGSDASRTNPDIVVHREGYVRAAGDVKYKSLAVALGGIDGEEPRARRMKKEGRPDLYQLLVHAGSLGTDRAFLVYAGDEAYACRYLGLSATGCHTWTTQVRPTHLVDDLSRFLDESGLL